MHTQFFTNVQLYSTLSQLKLSTHSNIIISLVKFSRDSDQLSYPPKNSNDYLVPIWKDTHVFLYRIPNKLEDYLFVQDFSLCYQPYLDHFGGSLALQFSPFMAEKCYSYGTYGNAGISRLHFWSVFKCLLLNVHWLASPVRAQNAHCKMSGIFPPISFFEILEILEKIQG